jgi:hypothetical protein
LVVPDEEEYMDMINMGTAESDEVVFGEVVRDGDDEERSGSRVRIWVWQ